MKYRAAVESPRRPVGTWIAGRYRVCAVLGAGSSSVVYAATCSRGREVAVKVLSPDSDEVALDRERLFREARLLAALEHPGFVRVLDVGPLPDGTAYLAMERLRGRTLAERLDEVFWLPMDEALRLGRGLLDALQAAHAAGVVHRDVNPSNVFLEDGPAGDVVRLIDFGIGRAFADPASRVTAEGVVLGTLGFMAPEQLFGEEPSPRSDLYGAAATLYCALAGRPPHDPSGGVAEVLRAMATEPEPLDALRPALPAPVAAGVMRALSRRPDDRPRSCRELADSLRAAA